MTTSGIEQALGGQGEQALGKTSTKRWVVLERAGAVGLWGQKSFQRTCSRKQEGVN